MVRLVKSVRDYSSRREQWRLLLLILPLGLVIVLMTKLRDPETANRINRVFAQLEVEQPPAAAAIAAPRRGVFPGIRRELFESIDDNTYFRNAEKEAWFHFLEVLQRAPAGQMRAAHGVSANYTQLVDQPGYYRGKLVTVQGWVRQVTEQKPAANDLGIEFYYRVVVQPANGVQWPIFVYCRELPPGLTAGGDLKGTTKATGLFFKNLSYRWQDGLGIAPVILAQTIEYSKPGNGEPVDGSHPPIVADAWSRVEPQTASGASQADKQSTSGDTFRKLLDLSGWSVARLAQFDDGQPLSDDQRQEAVELLLRLRSFDSATLANWSRAAVALNDVLAEPDDYHGRLIRLKGRVTRVTKHALNAADAQRLEMPQYFQCELQLDKDAGTATVLAARVPRAWSQMNELNEPATAAALYIKRLPDHRPAKAVWLAKGIAWHPTTADEPYVSSGESVLGALGMDVGMLDEIASRGRLRTTVPEARARFNEQREAFYQMLGAAGQIGAHELIRLAQENLANVRVAWQRELANASDEARRDLAKEVVDRAEQGRYSVAPLFNDPDSQMGRLIVVDGVARRVMRIEVGSRPDGDGPSDVARRFGFNHYFEMEVFTVDSQNYPLVFCMRELPPGFPTGGSIHVPVRAAGFFFKDWIYHTRGSGQSEVADGRAQHAPLLVGRAPLVLTIEQGGRVAQFVLGGLFVMALAGIWAVVAWYARGDRRFRDLVLAERFSLPPGQSLNELNLSAEEEPMKK